MNSKADNIRCERNGMMIRSDNCIPNIEPEVCNKCKSRQQDNPKSINNRPQKDEDEMKYEGGYRSSIAYAIEDGYGGEGV